MAGGTLERETVIGDQQLKIPGDLVVINHFAHGHTDLVCTYQLPPHVAPICQQPLWPECPAGLS